MKFKNLALAAAFVTATLLPAGLKADTSYVSQGETKVYLSQGFVSALSSLGVSAGAAFPGTLVKGVATFPITVGVADLADTKVEIGHVGGLTLTAGKTTVKLLNFDIEVLDSSPVITGIVTVNGAVVGRLPLFNLAIGNVYQPNKFTLSVQNVTVTLSSQAAAALNSVFSVSAFAGGFGIGTASTFTYVQPIFCY